MWIFWIAPHCASLSLTAENNSWSICFRFLLASHSTFTCSGSQKNINWFSIENNGLSRPRHGKRNHIEKLTRWLHFYYTCALCTCDRLTTKERYSRTVGYIRFQAPHSNCGHINWRSLFSLLYSSVVNQLVIRWCTRALSVSWKCDSEVAFPQTPNSGKHEKVKVWVQPHKRTLHLFDAVRFQPVWCVCVCVLCIWHCVRWPVRWGF